MPTRPAHPERLPALIGEICREIVGGVDARPMIVCRNVQKSYGEREVLKSIDLTVNRGEVVVVMGPSGSGKSTLLRMSQDEMALLEEPYVPHAVVGFD